MRLSSLAISVALPVGKAATCNADNCLRALRAPAQIVEAQSFCATFTTTTAAGTSAIPTYAIAACTGDVASRVSSACSCIAVSTSSSTTINLTTTVVTPTLQPTSETSITSSSSTAPTSTPTRFPSGPKACVNSELSCQNLTVVEDLCCFNAPGGQLLQTQFWDTSPSTGMRCILLEVETITDKT
jgi:hypothetical protein